MLGSPFGGARFSAIKSNLMGNIGGAMPMSNIPMAVMATRQVSKGMDKMSSWMRGGGSVTYTGKHGFVEANPTALPLYLNSIRKPGRMF